MKTKKLLLSLFALLTATTAWADVQINTTNFPDENFRNWLLSQSYGRDHVLTEAEIAGIKTIDVSSKSIQSLKGVEYFTALTRLWCPSNRLTSLDMSQNTKLTLLLCYDNQLTSLDVSHNTALIYLGCHKNLIKGAAMDTLVESLPTKARGTLRVIYHEDEQNVMTTEQVAAAKAKGWTPFYSTGEVYEWGEEIWEEYAGSEPGGITGDLNGDFKIDIADAVSILNLMAEGSDNPDADLNNDGKVDIADFVSVLNLMAGQ